MKMTAHEDDTSTPPPTASRRRKLNPWIVLGAFGVLLYLISYRPSIDAIACDDKLLASQLDVVMLGTSWCPYCDQARRHFQDEGIRYCEFDIERSAEGKRRYEQLQGGPIPILIFGDRYRLDGYDERFVDGALERLRQEREQHDS